MRELTFLMALLAGLFGSTHCLAMCGGIATALGGASGRRLRWEALLYHGGRIASYTTAGAIAGALGAAAGFAFAASSWSALLRLGTAFMVTVIGLDISLGTRGVARWLRAPERWGGRLWRRLAPARRLSLPCGPKTRALMLGLLWGWLPCGLVYSVLLAAALAGGAVGGSLTMLGFGLGTLPALSALSYAGGWLPRRDRLTARLLGGLLVACGIWTAVLPLAMLSGAHMHHHSGAPAPYATAARLMGLVSGHADKTLAGHTRAAPASGLSAPDVPASDVAD
jgi:hypothetical protein